MIAARLAKADPKLSVLLIEAGKSDTETPYTQLPALHVANHAPETGTMKYMIPRETKHATVKPVGKAHVLGGGTSVNVMVYTRPSPS